MDAVLVAAVSAAISIAVALIGAFVARRKGLPGINAEIEDRMQVLVGTLREEIKVKVDQFDGCVIELRKTKIRVAELERQATDADLKYSRLLQRVNRAHIDDDTPR